MARQTSCWNGVPSARVAMPFQSAGVTREIRSLRDRRIDVTLLPIDR